MADWMMLDRFVFRRDDDPSFHDDEAALCARGTTSQGDTFRVAFRIVDPPCVSRLYLQWPGVPKEGSSCDLVAAHRNLLLLRLTSGPMDKDGSLVHPQDYFLCEGRRPSSLPDQPPLNLHRIPVCTIPLVFHLDHGKERTAPRPFDLHAVGILSHGEEFAVAQLCVTKPHRPGRVAADLCVLRSNVNTSDHSWEVEQHLPITYDRVELYQLERWRTDIVVPFDKLLCWVNYSLGAILFCEVLEERPAITYLPLPARGKPGDSDPHHTHDQVKCRCCCVCTTEGGHKLMYINIGHEGTNLVGPLSATTGFTGHILRKEESGRMEWDKIFAIRSNQLWFTYDFPREPLIFPLANVVKPDVIYFLMSEEAMCGVNKVYVVSFDINANAVLILPYITDDLEGKDADFVQRKSFQLDPFIASELPRFLGNFLGA
ncbi:uncharacterized protein [Lolium perenne]|jgi:hypothetical protein|uniref:uncharacterized protein n=1 Tax=Lolium perenne TaxID=4522 RepID=UPI0021EAF848